jgi:hypothetical protein
MRIHHSTAVHTHHYSAQISTAYSFSHSCRQGLFTERSQYQIQSAFYTDNSLILISKVSTISRDSAVGIETGYGQDDREVRVRVPVEARIFSSPRRPDRFWSPPSHLSNGYRGIFPRGIKRAEGEAGHSPATSAEVKKKTWIYTSTSLYAFMAYRDNFTFHNNLTYESVTLWKEVQNCTVPHKWVERIKKNTYKMTRATTIFLYKNAIL